MEKEALLCILLNRAHPLSWTWEELGTINNEVMPTHHVWLESGYNVWKDCAFHIPKNVNAVEKDIIQVRVWPGLFQPAWGLYWNTVFSVSKNNTMYLFIISAVSANQHALEDTKILPNVKESSETFARMPISSLIGFHLEYDQEMLHEERRHYMAFQTTQGIHRLTKLV